MKARYDFKSCLVMNQKLVMCTQILNLTGLYLIKKFREYCFYFLLAGSIEKTGLLLWLMQSLSKFIKVHNKFYFWFLILFQHIHENSTPQTVTLRNGTKIKQVREFAVIIDCRS